MKTFAPAPERTPAPRRAEPAKRAATPLAEAAERVPMYGAGHSLAALLPPSAPPADPRRGEASRLEAPVAQLRAQARSGATPRVDTSDAGTAAPPAEPPRRWLERPAERSAATRRPNRTGLPDRLKANVEAMSGLSMDDVRVHRNSSKPAQLQALAYARGTEIHLGPGQERHLPHEAWHVVQQKQGRVRPTLQLREDAINNDRNLERESDTWNSRAGFAGNRPENSSRYPVDILQLRIDPDFTAWSGNRTVTRALLGNFFDEHVKSELGRARQEPKMMQGKYNDTFKSIEYYMEQLTAYLAQYEKRADALVTHDTVRNRELAQAALDNLTHYVNRVLDMKDQYLTETLNENQAINHDNPVTALQNQERLNRRLREA